MPMVELRGLSALEAWSRKVTQGYKDVKVHDLSTSWRDGLAFCALIHHFRPDLIDFDSLSKENILFNNRLAFQIAEKHLGVPSLLDAEDMFNHEEPDRLSVATYLSQFYECFEGPKSDRKHSITKSSPFTTTTTSSSAPSKTVDNITNTTDSSDTTGSNSRPIPPKRDMKCHKCKTRVYILERLIIDDICYHKACYDSLIPDTDPGVRPKTNDNITEINLNDIKLEESCQQIDTDNNNSVDIQSTQPISVSPSGDPIDESAPNQSIIQSKIICDKPSMEKPVKPQIPAKTFLKSMLLSANSSTKPDMSSVNDKVLVKSSEVNECRRLENFEKTTGSTNNTNVDQMFDKVFGKSVRISDQINEIISKESESEGEEDKEIEEEEVNEEEVEEEEVVEKEVVEEEKEEDEDITPKKIYPDDKNPFGDEEEEEDTEIVENFNKKVRIDSSKVSPHEYPDDKNPFDDEEENDEELSKTSNIIKPEVKLETTRRSSDALNPFGDDEDIDDDNNDDNYSTPKPKPRQSLNVSTPSSAVPSPTSSLRARKKRTAPTPPTTSTPSLPQMNSSCSLSSSFAAASGDSSRRDSVISSVSSDFGSSVPNSRTPTPLPRHKIQKSTEELSNIADIHQNDDQSSSLYSISSDSDLKKTSTSDLRIKKRLAPPIPAVKRTINGSLAEIEEELNSIGDQLPTIEQKNKELEQILLQRLEENQERQTPIESNTAQTGSKNDVTMDEFLSNARERCRLGRRQKELMYMKREHKLEEIQADIEYQMRCVMSKQAAQKTDDDHKQEEELLQRLMEIIEERNVIVENMIDDENKEVEEFQRLVSKVTPTKPSISGLKVDSKKEAKLLAKNKTIDKNLVKLKDKLKLKDIKEQKKLKKLEKSMKTPEKSEKSTNSLDDSSDKSAEKSSETLKSKPKDNSSKYLTLKSTLKPFRKSLGLKSSSDQKSDKKVDKNKSTVVTEQQTNGSNASINDKN